MTESTRKHRTYLPLLAAPDALLAILPSAPKRVEVKATPLALGFRVTMDRDACLVSFAVQGERISRCSIATKTGSNPCPLPEETQGIVELWRRVSWVQSLTTSGPGSDYAPNEWQREQAHLFDCLKNRGRLTGVNDLVDAFDAEDWGTAITLAEDGTYPDWFEPFRLALHGGIKPIIAHASVDASPGGRLAVFRARARQELGLIQSAFDDLAGALGGRAPSDRAEAYAGLAVLAGALGRTGQAIELLSRALRLSTDDEFVARCASDLMRMGGYSAAQIALRAHTARLDVSPDVWIIRAELALWCGRTSDAREFIADAGADGSRASLLLGIADAMDGNDDGALTRLRAVSGPDQREAHAWTAELLKRRGEDATALDHLNSAMIGSQNAVHTLLGSFVEDEVNHECRTLFAALGVEQESDQTPATAAKLLRTFHGNRSAQPSRSASAAPVESAAELSEVPTPPASAIRLSRVACQELLKTLRYRPVAEIHQGFDELQRTYPDSAHPYCYHGELLLWEGRYDDAEAAFNGNNGAQVARWGHVGRAAVQVHRHRFDEALAEFDQMRRSYAPLPGATTHVYMGELHRLRGDLALALEELAIATGAKPGRIGARINQVMCWALVGQIDRAQADFDTLTHRWPNLFWHATNAIGVEWADRGDALLDVCESALRLMRGNRSSHTHTFFDETGAMRLTLDAPRWWRRLQQNKIHLRKGIVERMLLTDAPTY